MILYHLPVCIVNKHGKSGFAANNFLTRRSSTLKCMGPNVQPRLYPFSFVDVLYVAFRGSQQCHQFICVHTTPLVCAL